MSLNASSAGEMGRKRDWGYISRAESAEDAEEALLWRVYSAKPNPNGAQAFARTWRRKSSSAASRSETSGCMNNKECCDGY